MEFLREILWQVAPIRYFFENISRIITYTQNHLELTLVGVILAIILWVSVGIIIYRYPKLSHGVLGIASIVMCVPSIALYGILLTLPGFGLGRTSALTALVLYAMLPIVRNVFVALRSVEPSILDAARGMGMSKQEVLWEVQIPNALPTIFAGVRVALVMMVGIATLATYIGEQNLGRLIQHGITRTHPTMIIVGAVVVSIIAIGIDLLMGLLGKHLISKGLQLEESK